MSDGTLAERLVALRSRIQAAAERAQRDPAEITLVGVSKHKRASEIAEAVRAGVHHIGENYLQESQSKIPEVHGLVDPAELPHWHFIGQLQRNKVRHVVRLFNVVETVDRIPLGAELERRALQAGRRLRVLLQVDLCGEPQKGGVPPALLPELLKASQDWKHLDTRGLMTVPAASQDPAATRATFATLRRLRQEHRGLPGGERLDELSMGMSGDFEVAIEEGATIIRVGTALFGARK